MSFAVLVPPWVPKPTFSSLARPNHLRPSFAFPGGA